MLPLCVSIERLPAGSSCAVLWTFRSDAAAIVATRKMERATNSLRIEILRLFVSTSHSAEGCRLPRNGPGFRVDVPTAEAGPIARIDGIEGVVALAITLAH